MNTSVWRREGDTNGNRGLCVWFTGRPCSGKTSIAVAVTKAAVAAGRTVTLLDGEDVRPILCPDLGFSEEHRLMNLQRIAFVSREVVRHGGLAIVATVSPFCEHRKLIRSTFEREEFMQVYIRASLEECERRDVKGMYARARRGELPSFTGLTSPYELPMDSEVECDTEHELIDHCVAKVGAAIANRIALLSATDSRGTENRAPH